MSLSPFFFQVLPFYYKNVTKWLQKDEGYYKVIFFIFLGKNDTFK